MGNSSLQFQSFENVGKSRDVNCEPLSVTSCSGIPWRGKWAFNFLMTHTDEGDLNRLST